MRVQFEVGEEVAVAERDDEKPEFVYVTTRTGAGWVPARHLTITGGRRVHSAHDTTELATHTGDALDVIEDDHRSGWTWCRAADGRQGWVPTRTLTDQPSTA